jgi:hypothetical protein
MKIDGQTICITGITGFIGAAIAERSISLGLTVKGLDISAKGPVADSLIRLGVSIVEGSTLNTDAVRRAVADSNIVVHCAALMDDALPWDDIMEANVKGVCITRDQRNPVRSPAIRLSECGGCCEIGGSARFHLPVQRNGVRISLSKEHCGGRSTQRLWQRVLHLQGTG